MKIIAAADGSCLKNPDGPTGWAWYVDETCWASGGSVSGTNNIGELTAVLELLRATAHVPHIPLHIICDSQYVINSITEWMPGWKAKGWVTRGSKPVKNLALMQALDIAVSGRLLTFEHVRGHTGHELNERADTLCGIASRAYRDGAELDTGPGFVLPARLAG